MNLPRGSIHKPLANLFDEICCCLWSDFLHSLMATHFNSWSLFWACFRILIFNSCHRFSIEFNSGLIDGHGNSVSYMISLKPGIRSLRIIVPEWISSSQEILFFFLIVVYSVWEIKFSKENIIGIVINAGFLYYIVYQH